MPMWLAFVKEILPQWVAVALIGFYVFQSSKRNLEQHIKIVDALDKVGRKVHDLHSWHDVDTPGKPGVKIWWEQNETLMLHSTLLSGIKATTDSNGAKLAQCYSTLKANQECLKTLENEAIKRGG